MKFIEKVKPALLGFLNRLRPRKTFRWIFSATIWLIIIVYISFGIYFGRQIYDGKNASKKVRTSAYFYPYAAVIVNGKIVWANAYFEQLNYIEQYSAKTKDSSYVEADVRKKIIDTLIENEILEFQALRYNLRVGNKEFNTAYNQIVDKAGGESSMKKVLNDLYGMNEREFKNLVRQQVLKEKVRNELMLRVKVAHIFIKDEARAKEVADKANKGEDFGGLAKTYSEDKKSSENGGDLGWLAKGELVIENKPLTEFDDAAFTAKSGQIVGPIKTPAGFEIIKIDGKKGIVSESFNSWLENLIKKSKIWRLIK